MGGNRAEKRTAKEAERMAKEQARRKAWLAREQALEEAYETKRAREKDRAGQQ